ncbi:MAG: SusD/RagB family nutrient-binding outer membrane lipoprotein [Muribaculaceae bacterium]|nr:SusD/RagB family nutrient-binding outer membrane lipoprotein [Muribaculaceae bacterium]
MKKIFLASLLVLGLAATSCDDYLDINQDPNSPTEENMTPNMMLPAAEMNIAHSYGDYLRTVGGYFAQHYSQEFGTSNYLDYSQFNQSAVRSSGMYRQLCTRAMNNLKYIREYAEANGEWGNYLAATVLRAFSYQLLVDCYGEVPYTEALDLSNLTPHYDDGQVIYDGILAELDDALAKASGSDQVATSILFPGGSAKDWIKFANALKLRILTRESGVKDVNSKIGALISENNFPSKDVQFAGCWKNEAGQANPFFMEDAFASYGASQMNIILNVALLNTMSITEKDFRDGRLAAYFSPNGSNVYTGGVSGTNFSTALDELKNVNYWCRPNAHFNDPVVLMSVSEINFLICEYYAKNKNSVKAQEYYSAAIKASFNKAGAAGFEDVLAQYPLDMNNYKKSIGIQKWVDLSGYNSFEAWCEMRRLGYPAMSNVKGEQVYNEASKVYNPGIVAPGTLYHPINANPVLTGILQRFPYAESSANRNQNTPTYPGDNAPVFWAK